MVDHIFKRHVTLRPIVTTGPLKSAEQRVLGDSRDWDEAGTEIRHEGDGSWRTELPLKAGPFLQAVSQWKIQEPAPPAALPRTVRDEELRTQDPSST